ncbi:MAG: DUF58 domain-containing protein [Saprospiraceae bacterium]|nr:DUF58 domain-containing protein [Saprospiraceae bacterium]
MNFIADLYLKTRFFIGIAVIIICFIIGAFYPMFFVLAKIILGLYLLFIAYDISTLMIGTDAIKVNRKFNPVFSLDFPNSVNIVVFNQTKRYLKAQIYDEVPHRFAEQTKAAFNQTLLAQEETKCKYHLTPNHRGKYHFSDISVFILSKFQLFERKFRFESAAEVKVYPSIMLMKKYQLSAIEFDSMELGLKKQRKLGLNSEFDQIQPYIKGDDVRTINWKATAKVGNLMVNRFIEERAQSVYTLVDCSRSTLLPFHNLSLLEHAVNTALVISNIALQKQDKAGLLLFHKKPIHFIKANQDRLTLNKIIETLYNAESSESEANYEALYFHIKTQIKQRSLLILITNFDHLVAMERALPILRLINKNHLLVTVLFNDVELEAKSMEVATTTKDIFAQAFAQKFVRNKKEIAHALKAHGIQTILTNPQDLLVNTINKYLELKSRGLI